MIEWVFIISMFTSPTSGDTIIIKRFNTYEACASYAGNQRDNCIATLKTEKK